MTPAIHSVVETVIYVDDLTRSIDFYSRVLGLEKQLADDRFCAFTVTAGQVFLVFQRGASGNGAQTPGGLIPSHDASGQQHFAFGIAAAEFELWNGRLQAGGVAIESAVDWPRGARSLFFRDPDGHLAELVTPGAWTNY
jgi:catechol 2,3-dioxygenase-like lactoylglutathione lyase family enzyme